MRRAMVILLAVSSLAAVQSGCDGGAAAGKSTPASSGSESSSQTSTQEDPAPVASAQKDACEELMAAMVRRAVGLADSVELVQRPRRSSHGGCYYQWDNPDYDLAAAMRAGADGAPSGKDLRDPKFLVGYLRGARYPDAAAAEKAFEQSQFHLPAGGGAAADAGKEPVAVDDVGDAAMWTPGNAHIAVRDGTRLFFVNLRIGSKSADEQRAIAEKLARDIIAAG